MITIKPTAEGPVLCTRGHCNQRTPSGQCIHLNHQCHWLNNNNDDPATLETKQLRIRVA